jgi:hypothetical protein
MWEARRSVRDSRWHPCGRVLALRLPISSSTCCSISISLLRLRLALGFVADGGGHDGDGGNGGGGDGGCGHGGMLAVSEGGGDQSSSASGSSSTGGGGGGGVSRAVGSEQGGVMCGDARALCVRKEEKWFSCDNSLTRAGRPTHSPPRSLTTCQSSHALVTTRRPTRPLPQLLPCRRLPATDRRYCQPRRHC